MSNEVVAYSNDMHSVALAKLKPADSRVFFTLCQRLKEKGTKEVTFTWAELRSLANLSSNRDPQRFSKRLARISENLVSLPIYITHEDGWEMFSLFQYFKVKESEQTLTVEVSPRFEYLLNKLEAKFVRWELPQFLKLKGKYAQAMFRYLKQFRSTGIWSVDIEEFRRNMNIPKSYRIPDITKRAIEPAITELRPFFGSIQWRYTKQQGPGGRGQGGQVTRVTFTFQTQLNLDQDWESPLLNTEGWQEPPGEEEKPQLTRAQQEQLEMQEASYKAQLHRKLKEKKS